MNISNEPGHGLIRVGPLAVKFADRPNRTVLCCTTHDEGATNRKGGTDAPKHPSGAANVVLRYSSWRSNTSFAPTMRTTIEIVQPIGVSIDAG
jgi:hypothetical protein